MGKIICEKHGDQGIVLTCEHVRQDILSATPSIKCVVTARHEIEKFGDESVNICLGYCDMCANRYGLPLVDGVLADRANEFSDQTQPVCSECLKEFRKFLRKVI